ncbi:barrier-to-autointegration factor-like isoform X2 [Misgurnus anguillicaudatus]|uniref:barrier-to-autointegration factor-like isoform X2 n=1 Tax=Misgurnus anguillicaudatus TaxID=75329 RepID=UPI003CCF35CB
MSRVLLDNFIRKSIYGHDLLHQAANLNRKALQSGNTSVQVYFVFAMTTSQKHRSFCSEPMGDKSVYALPGIGPVLGGRLEKIGIRTAKDVLGRFLILGMDEWKFKSWLRDSCGANAKHQRDCYNCLREWTNNFL